MKKDKGVDGGERRQSLSFAPDARSAARLGEREDDGPRIFLLFFLQSEKCFPTPPRLAMIPREAIFDMVGKAAMPDIGR